MNANSPPNLSAALRARLFTTHGTALYIDAASGELRHGAIEGSAPNALFVTDPASDASQRRGWLMHDNGAALVPVACIPGRSWAIGAGALGDNPPEPTVFELVPLERGLLGLGCGSLYLCAQPDGRIALENPWCSTWECFLASEDWCTPPHTEAPGKREGDNTDWRGIAEHIVEPLLRARSRRTSATKVLIFGHTQWSHGRVYYDLCKALSERGYVVDLLDWQVGQGWKIDELLAYYDLWMCALNGIQILIDIYRVPPERIIALSHGAMDMRMLIEQKGVEVFDKFAGYGVVGYHLFELSALLGIKRPPSVVQLGVAIDEFRADPPERLTTVGYAGSYSLTTADGIEIKRGDIAEAAVRAAGLEFRRAGADGAAVSFHGMRDFYKSVDAVIVSSVSEAAGLPAREAAAAGRLVISTPVGDFPLLAAQGCGIVAPIEADRYQDFVTATLAHYRDHPTEFAEKCCNIHAATDYLDWHQLIGDWVELIAARRINNDNRIILKKHPVAEETLVICPTIVTGGPECLHQLCSGILAFGGASRMIYTAPDMSIKLIENNIVSDVDKTSEMIRAYSQYKTCHVAGSVGLLNKWVIFPEVYTKIASNYKFDSTTIVAIWWLSVDTAFIFNRDLADANYRQTFFSNDRFIHFYQSDYARAFLEANKARNLLPLGDYVGDEFIRWHRNNENESRTTRIARSIAYFPAKGAELSMRFREAVWDERFQFIEISHLSRPQVMDALSRTQVYIDFGHHPGRDRVPREAAMMGAVVLIRNVGAGAHFDDHPLSDAYRFDEHDLENGRLLSLVRNILSEPDIHYAHQRLYRDRILGDKETFLQQVQQVFFTD